MAEEAAQDWEDMVMWPTLGLGTLGSADMGGVEHQGLEVLEATLDLEDMAMLERLVWPGVGLVSGAQGMGVLQGLVDLEGGLDWGDMAQEAALVWVVLQMAMVGHTLLWVESTKVGWEALGAAPSQPLQSCRVSRRVAAEERLGVLLFATGSARWKDGRSAVLAALASSRPMPLVSTLTPLLVQGDQDNFFHFEEIIFLC